MDFQYLSLGMNKTLKTLFVVICDDFGDELCAAITEVDSQ
jgi:hypothetical protein